MDKWERVVVTGGTGFFGLNLVKALIGQGYYETYPIGRKTLNLLDQEATIKYFINKTPDVVIHLAARVGGIQANRLNPFKFWFENISMGVNILSACQFFKPKKIIMVCTTCAYPKLCPTPFKESDLWNGYPEETNAPYAIAKRDIMLGAMQFEKDYGIPVRCPIPTNLYGPGDHYGDDSNHVIPALIEKFHKARVSESPKVTLWGDGSPTRDFLHVRDASLAIIKIMESAETSDPINVGSGVEIAISDIAETIADIVGYEGEIIWDTEKPNGQPKRVLDVNRLEALGWKQKIDLIDGLRETYEDYMRRFSDE